MRVSNSTVLRWVSMLVLLLGLTTLISASVHADMIFPHLPGHPDAAFQEYVFPSDLRTASREKPGIVIFKEVLRSTSRVVFSECQYFMVKVDDQTHAIKVDSCQRVGREQGYSLEALDRARDQLEKEASYRHKLQFVLGGVAGVVAWRSTGSVGKIARVVTTVTAAVTGLFVSQKIMRVLFPKEELADYARVDSVSPHANLDGQGVEQSYVFVYADMRQLRRTLGAVAIRAAQLDPLNGRRP